MNQQLANYIFAHETIYTEPKVANPAKASNETLYQKELLLISPPIEPTEKIFLGKMLAAIGFSFENIDWVESSNSLLSDFQMLSTQILAKKVLLFGVYLKALNWPQGFSLNEIKHSNAIEFLFSEKLDKIESDIEQKKMLWANLQKMFPKKV